MKILAIGDIHCRKFWREAIEKYSDKVDKVVFLGDYLDPYYEEIKETPELMECEDFYDVDSNLKMLEDIMSLKNQEPDKYVLLTGNHTDGYIWPSFTKPTRSDNFNYNTYRKFFTDNLTSFNLVFIQDDVIFSHAGILEGWAQETFPDEDFPVKAMANYLSTKKLTVNYDFPEIGNLSMLRGGWNRYGSCEWADIREHIYDFISINNYKARGEKRVFQVFGHTQLKEPLINDKWACIDCRKAFIINTETHECKDCI